MCIIASRTVLGVNSSVSYTKTPQPTIVELAQATTLPLGTVRMGVQWLLACGLIEWLTEGECYQAVRSH